MLQTICFPFFYTTAAISTKTNRNSAGASLAKQLLSLQKGLCPETACSKGGVQVQATEHAAYSGNATAAPRRSLDPAAGTKRDRRIASSSSNLSARRWLPARALPAECRRRRCEQCRSCLPLEKTTYARHAACR